MHRLVPKRYREYETVFILAPIINQAAADTITKRIQGLLDQYEGKLTKVSLWGMRRLAYRIKKHDKGIYYQLNYVAPQGFIDEMEKYFRLQDGILRYLTVKLSPYPVDPTKYVVRDSEVEFAKVDEISEEPAAETGVAEEYEAGEAEEEEEAGGKEAEEEKAAEPEEEKAKAEKPVKEAAEAKAEKPAEVKKEAAREPVKAREKPAEVKEKPPEPEEKKKEEAPEIEMASGEIESIAAKVEDEAKKLTDEDFADIVVDDESVEIEAGDEEEKKK
jgi:small subunit ribosomal protein S6